MNLEELKAPFSAADVEWRIQQSGISNGKPWAMVLCYVTNRAIQDRLDEVCGPSNWRNEYSPAPDGGIMCGLSIKCDDEWVTKWDGAENTQVEAVKGGLSNSMKRAAVQWGIGRYLYNLDATFAECFADNSGTHKRVRFERKEKGIVVETIYGSWNTPTLPEWALPGCVDKMARMVSALRSNTESVAAIQSALAEGNIDYAAECWSEISDDDRQALSVAPSKGGIFTMEEAKLMKSDEFKEARKRYIQNQ